MLGNVAQPEAGGGAVEASFEGVPGELGRVGGADAVKSQLGFDEFAVKGHGRCFSGICAGKARLG